MALSDNKIAKLDKILIELSTKNFEEFCIIAGVDKVQAYVCLERKAGKSFGEIGQSIGLTKQAIQQRCKKCTA